MKYRKLPLLSLQMTEQEPMLVAWNADILISFLFIIIVRSHRNNRYAAGRRHLDESTAFRGVARELVRTAYHRANTVAQNPATEGEGCWYPLIKNTTIPAKDLEALAATNRGMIFLGEFDKNTVPRKRLRKYDNVVGKTALDGVVAVLALVKSKRSRRTLKTRIYRAPEIH